MPGVSDWEAVSNEEGQTYYFNRVTNETSWTPPEGFKDPSSSQQSLPPNWTAAVDESSGKTYYFNSETNETSWTVPEGTTQGNNVSVNFNEDEEGGDAVPDMVSSSRRDSRGQSPGRKGRASVVHRTVSRTVSKRGVSPARSNSKRGLSPAPRTKSSNLGGMGLGIGKGSMKAAQDLMEEEDEDDGPDENDDTYEAKVKRFQMFEKKCHDLLALVEYHRDCLTQAFENDAKFTQEAVSIAGTEEPELRSAACAAWAGAGAAGMVADNYCLSVHTILINQLKEDIEFFKQVNTAMKERTDVDKEFAHYIAKLADLRMKSDKVDPKKLARNTQKYDETMIKLEASTESAIELFTKAEEMRERLITKEFVAWQKAQHMHLSILAEAYQGESSTPWTSPDGIKFIASECPIQGFKKNAEIDTESGTVLPTPKAKVASSWRTNLKHRLKYGAAADFAATDEDMEANFTLESAFYGEFEKSIPILQQAASTFVEKMDEAFRCRVDIDENFSTICCLPRGGDDKSRKLTDFERFSSYDSNQITTSQIEGEIEARLDADIDVEEALEATVEKYVSEIKEPLDELVGLFKQPTVLEMFKERPTLLASVNHYRSKMKEIEKSIEDAKKSKDKVKGAKTAEAQQKKLESNQAKHDAEAEKLGTLTTQLIASFHSTEAKCFHVGGSVVNISQAAKIELAKFISKGASEIDTHNLVAGGGGGRESTGRGPRSRRRGKSSASPMKGKPYDPNKPSRKALLKSGLGENGLPLKLAELRYEQAVTLQADMRRLMAVLKYHQALKHLVKLQTWRRAFCTYRWYYYTRYQWIPKHQALVRGAAVRRDLKKKTKVVIKVQRLWGGYRIKQKFKNSVAQVVKIQSVGRGHVIRARVRKWNRAALVIGSTIRMKKGKMIAKDRFQKVLKIQGAARRWLIRIMLKRWHKATTKLQALVRGRQATSKTGGDKDKVVKIQSVARKMFAKNKILKMHIGASAMQAAYFGLCARMNLRKAKNSAATIQALVRGVMLRHGCAKRVVETRHFKISWPDHTIASFMKRDGSGKLRRGSCISSIYPSQGSVSIQDSPMASRNSSRRSPNSNPSFSLSPGAEDAQLNKSKKVHEQLMLFDDKVLSLVSVVGFLKMVRLRRHLFIKHKCAGTMQAMVRSKQQFQRYKQVQKSSVMVQAAIRLLVYSRRLKRQKKAARVLQNWLRRKRQSNQAWKAMLKNAQNIAQKAREEKASTKTKAAWKIQREFRRRKYLRSFRQAVAEYLIKRERMKKIRMQDSNFKSLEAAICIQKMARGSMVRFSRDDYYYASRRRFAKNNGGSSALGIGFDDAGLSALTAAAGVLASDFASGMASGMSSMLGSFSGSSSSKASPNVKASLKKKGGAYVVPPPRWHRNRGKFLHFKTAVIVMQAFARRVIALHRLYSRGTISTNLAWRSSTAKRRGVHKMSWQRGHKGYIKTTGAALRSMTLLGFCKLVAMRRRLYAAECAAVCIQSFYRSYASRKHFKKTQRRVTLLQAVARGRRGSRLHREYKHSMLSFQALAEKRRRRTRFRGVTRMVVKLKRLARGARERVAEGIRQERERVIEEKRSVARLAIQRFVRGNLCRRRWNKIRRAVVKVQSRARKVPAKRRMKALRKAGHIIAEFITRRHRQHRMFKSLIELVRIAAKGGGGGGGGSSKENRASFKITTFFKQIKAGPQVQRKVLKRVLKAGLKFKALAQKAKEEQDKAKEEVRELQLELRVTRKHSEETAKQQQERTDKMIEQQMEALKSMQMQSNQSADMSAIAAQLEAFKGQMVAEVSSGGGGGDTTQLYRRIERQEDELSDCRKKIDTLEVQRDELKKELRQTTKQAKSLSNELFDVKKGYMEQRGINAKLMLEVQSLKGNIQVCCRIRPYNNTEKERGDEPAVALITESEIGVLNNQVNDWETYGFDQVWGGDSTQEQVFEQVEALALSVVDGYNACICCYGQTGSGKTFTMTGLPREGKPGISFQTMDKVFEMLNLKVKTANANRELAERLEEEAADRRRMQQANGDGKVKPPPPNGSATKITSFEWSAKVSMLEIYNEEVRCLLTEAPKKKDKDGPKKLDIKQGKDGLMTVPGLVSQDVEDTEGVLDAFEQGNATRSVSATAMNATSSRSHMVLMVDVTTRTNEGASVTGRLYLVDLAGSERVAKSGVTGQAMKEAQGINKSLSALGDVMEALDKGQSHIPFRNSKLTFLLQSALGGSARCMFIFNASPAEGNSDETRCTFKFASRMRNISLGAAKKNVDAAGLEEELMKAKREAKSYANDLHSLRSEYDKMKKSSNSGSSKDAEALERAEGKLALKEAEAAAADEEIATLRDQLADVQRALKAAKESSSHRSHSRGGSDSDHSDGEAAPRRRSESSGIPRVRRVSRSPAQEEDEGDEPRRDSSAARTRSPAPISTRLKPKTLVRSSTGESSTMRASSGRGHPAEPGSTSGRGRGGRTSSSSGYGASSSSKTPTRTRPQSTGSYSTSTVSSTSTKPRRSVGTTKDT